MKAMFLHENASITASPLRLEDRPLPFPNAGEVRVRVECCGICRTDLHVVEGDLPRRQMPIIPGHQVVGIVDALGPDCRRLRIGQRVGIAWLRHTCGDCEFCRAGRENLCARARFTGYDANGGYAEAALVPEAYAYVIPSAFAAIDAAPLLCAGIIGYRALKRSELPPGGTLGLFGFGSSAHVVLQIARHRGCRVFVATRGEGHREFARRLGAVWVGDSPADVPEPLDSAILFAPAGELVPSALASLKKGGTLALAGIYLSQIPPLDYERHLFHEKNLRSVTANTREDGRELLAEAARIALRARTTRYPLAEANRALQDLKSDRIDGTGVLVMDEIRPS